MLETPSPVIVAPDIASTSWSSLSRFFGSLFDFETFIPTSLELELKIFHR